MKSAAILLVAIFAIVLLFRRDAQQRSGVSGAAWLVLLWAIVLGSRPVSTWFGFDAAEGGVDAYIEGNPFERAVFFLLILAGTVVLVRRRLDLGAILRANNWLFVFYAYWAISIVWSDYPFVAFKRCFKDFGNVIMALVILTEVNPQQAARSVFVRCAYVLVPLSVLFIRYWPELGRTYSGYNSSDLMYVGVCTHKNTLGGLLLVCSLFLIWDLRAKSDAGEKFRWRLVSLGPWMVLLMIIWLLRVAHSATSQLCAVLGVGLYLATRLPLVRRRFHVIGAYLVGAGFVFWTLDQLFDVSNLVVSLLGRDMGFTGRSDAWKLVVGFVDNPLLGAGFKSFWSGERMVEIWKSFGGVVQAHNGYVETYLNGGLLGLGLLVGWLLSSFQKIKSTLFSDPDFGGFRLAVFVVVLFYNFSEAAFNQLGLLYFVLLIAAIEVPKMLPGMTSNSARAPRHRDFEFTEGIHGQVQH